MATYAEFQSDEHSEHMWLAEVSYLDTSDSTTGTLYYSTTGYGTDASDTPASQIYDARLMNGYDFAASAPPIGALGGMLPPREGGSLILGQLLGDLDFMLGYSFDGRRVVIRHGGYSPRYGMVAYSDFEVVFDGEVDGQALVGIDEVTLKLRNKDARFEFAIQDRSYVGGRYWHYFDGTNYIACGHAADAANAGVNFTTSDFTIEFFTYYETAPVSHLLIYSHGSINVDGVLVRMNIGGYIALMTCQAGVSQSTISSVLPLNKRVHVAIVRDGASVKIYFDGIDVTVTSGTHINPVTAARTLYVGCSNGLSLNYLGFLDEFRIWSVARSIGDIHSVRGRQLTTSEVSASTLRFYLKLDEGTGPTPTDSSTTAVACAITGGEVWYPSLQGDADLEGSSLPDVWGQREGYAPVLVDEPSMIYQVHSGPIYEMTTVYVGGVAIGLDTGGVSGGVYTSMVGFLAHVTTAGKYARLITDYGTWFKLGSQPNMPVTMKVKGDYTGGVYASTAGAIVRRIVCTRGPQPLTDPTDLDTTSFSDLETNAPYTVGDGYSDDMSIAEVVGFLLSSVGAVGYFARDTGKFTVKQFISASLIGPETAAADLSENDLKEGSLEVIDTGPPIWGVNYRYRKNDVVHSTTDVAASIIGDATNDTNYWRYLMNEWRTSRPRVQSTRDSFKGATALGMDTAVQLWADAATESTRLLALYDSQGQCLRGLFLSNASTLDRMDKVTFHFQDTDAINEPQYRLNTSASSVFIVLAVEDDVESGGTWLTLYREAMS